MSRLNKVIAIKLARQPESGYVIFGLTCLAWLPGLSPANCSAKAKIQTKFVLNW